MVCLRSTAALFAGVVIVTSCSVSRPPAAEFDGGQQPLVVVGNDAIIGVGEVSFATTGNLVATPVSAPLKDDWPDGVLSMGDGVDVVLSGQPVGSFPVTLRLPARPPDDAIPAVVHVVNGGDMKIDVLQGVVDEDESTITVRATEFSRLFPVWLNPVNWIAGVIDGISDYISGRTDPPRCKFDPPGWARTDAALGATHTCLQGNTAEDSSERAELSAQVESSRIPGGNCSHRRRLRLGRGPVRLGAAPSRSRHRERCEDQRAATGRPADFIRISAARDQQRDRSGGVQLVGHHPARRSVQSAGDRGFRWAVGGRYCCDDAGLLRRIRRLRPSRRRHLDRTSRVQGPPRRRDRVHVGDNRRTR